MRRSPPKKRLASAFFGLLTVLFAGPALADGVNTSYLWHMDQPIYWPAPDSTGVRYQRVWESIQAKRAGAAHPQNDLERIFGKDDRVNAYQYRPRDAIRAWQGQPDAGAQMSFSGGLAENLTSLGQANQLGYGPQWFGAAREARALRTSGGHPRLDVVQFSFHHGLLPLLDDRVVRMELGLFREQYAEIWGAEAPPSKGLFPSEMAFSEHLIPAIAESGIEWVVVSNSHISRACEDYPWVAGSGGDNIPPPNRADVQNPAQGTYNRISIDRGVSPANAVPFSYTPHRARYVNPSTGRASTLIVVPAAQSESWQDGYSCFGTGPIQALAAHNNPNRPMLVLLTHDGDNAFGGGYSYYMECTPNFVNQGGGGAHRPTTVQQYLSQYPPPADDIVHVESGAWVNADGDFGSPAFWNWNWPLVNAQGEVDIPGGWAEDERNWAVITAATQEVAHATDLLGEPRLAKILHPESGATDLEQAWHFLLGALNSGYMYYGTVLDMELKQAVACNEAVARARRAVSGRNEDRTGPTVWQPQRYPDNPGSINFGPLYRYRQVVAPSDFFVWTFIHDVNAVSQVNLFVRLDEDGRDPLDNDANQTYAGGPGVGPWRAVPMTRRAFPQEPLTASPEIDRSIPPTVIADQYYAEVRGVREALVDYFVEAVDAQGNRTRSPIQHVYVGAAEAQPEDPDGVHWQPRSPAFADRITVRSPSPGLLHWGVNGWLRPAEGFWPEDTVGFDTHSVETPLAGPDEDGFYSVELGPFADGSVTVVDFVIHRADGSWDNNGGGDYHISLTEGGDPEEVDGGLPPIFDGGVWDAAVGGSGGDIVGGEPTGGSGPAGGSGGHEPVGGNEPAGGAPVGGGQVGGSGGGLAQDGSPSDPSGGAADDSSGGDDGCAQRPGEGGALSGLLLLGALVVRRRRVKRA